MCNKGWFLPFVVLLVSSFTFPVWISASEVSDSNDPLRHLEFRQIGPAAGGRLSRVAGSHYLLRCHGLGRGVEIDQWWPEVATRFR